MAAVLPAMYEMEHKIQAVKHGCRFALNSTKPEHHPVLKKVITTCSNLFLARESIISRIITYLVIGLLNYPQLENSLQDNKNASTGSTFGFQP